MTAIGNSKPSRSSKKRLRASPSGRASAGVEPAGPLAWVAVILVAGSLGALTSWYVYAQGWTLYYGDAEAHFNIARRIFDSRTPGYEQIGTVWLPLPHVLLLPFVTQTDLWISGAAGALGGFVSLTLAVATMFGAARLAYGSTAAGVCAALILATNPNLLYLQAIPMTEALFLACVCGLLYFSLRFRATQGLGALVAAAVCSIAASLTRYDGWILIPFACAYIFWAARGERLRAALLFGMLASLGPLYWLGHNRWFYGDFLRFYNGPDSAKGIYQRALDAGMARYPGDHEWTKAAQYYGAAALLCIGLPLAWTMVPGFFAAVWRRAFWPLFLLSVLPAFYVLSMYSSGTPIFVPHLWPHSYYNTRYGITLLPLAAFAAAAIPAVLPSRLRTPGLIITLLIAISPWLAYPRAENWITWKESQVNSESRRAWTKEAADFLRVHYKRGDGILFSFGDPAGVLRASGIPIRESLHEGNGPLATAVFARPDLFLKQEWALAIAGDSVASLMTQMERTGSPYKLVHIAAVKGAPPVHIYRRIPPLPKPW